MIYRGSAAFVLLFSLSLFFLSSSVQEGGSALDAKDVALLALPKEMGEWTSTESPGLGVREQEILQLDTYIRRKYRRSDGKEIELYIGYWKTQSGDYQAAKHSPKTCLPSNGWEVLSSESIPSAALETNIASMLARYKSTHMLFDYWFFSGQEIYHEEWLALVKIVTQKLFYGRSDGGIVELSTRLSANDAASREAAEAVISDFISTFKQSFKP